MLEWGPLGAKLLAERSDVLVVVDVLSFTTSLTVAVERGARVWPHTGGETAHELAGQIGAVLAGSRSSHDGPTLSPVSLLGLDGESRLILPSPNGSSLSAALGAGVPVVAACLRNSAAVARHLAGYERIGIVAAGERWSDESLRPAYEDLVGAGALVERLSALDPAATPSPDAAAAAAAFRALRPLAECPSGVELVQRGFADDVALASELDASEAVPVLRDGSYVAATPVT